MKIKKDSKLIWLIKLNYHISNYRAFGENGSIPKSLCYFFWTAIGAILIIPFNIPGLIMALIKKDNNPGGHDYNNPFINIILQLCSIIIGAFTLTKSGLSVYIYESFIIKLLASMLTGVILSGISLGMCYIVDLFIRKFKPVKNKTLVGSYIKAKKDKVCPLIEFE